MLNKSVFLRGLFLFFFATLIVACSDSDDTQTVEEFVDDAVVTINRNATAGGHGCFEFVFPITVDLPDGSSITAESYEDLKTQVRAWKEANPDVEGRPSLAFPIELINEEGELVTVESKEQLRMIIRECRRDMAQQGPHKLRCFRLGFPVSISFPDGTVEEFASRKEAKMAIRAWRQENPDSEERPSLVFPVTVELEDETTVTINSAEELQALKDECAE